MNKLTEWLTKPFLQEDINLPVNVGDTILVGKFKNKKMVVKDIGVDDHGMPTINGRKATTFRIYKDQSDHEEVTIDEGVNDPGIFKAVFLAGGPGSGKTYVAKQLFGIPDKFNISMSGLKMVNSDKELKHLLNKFGFGTDLDKMPDELFSQLTNPKGKDYSGLRTYSKELTKQRMKQYQAGKLGMIIDGTGHDFGKLHSMKKELEKDGYDTYMVFVNTSLEVAQQRNQERDRILPPKLLKKSWEDVQKNLGRFQSLFKQNFLIVDNSKFLSAKDAEKKFATLVRKGVSKFVKQPIKSKLAKRWIKKQQILKKQGIKEDVTLTKKQQYELDKLYNQAFKMIPRSPAQMKVRKKIKQLRKKFKMDERKSNIKKVKKNLDLYGKKFVYSGSEIEENLPKIKKVVGIYGGRFQPFGPHHLKTYQWLSKQVDDAYITTSNIKQPPRHPMNFKEKVRHMVKMGIPKNRIIQEKSPYVAKNVLKKYDKDTTAVIYIFGAKDAGRLKGGKYFQDYKKNKNNMNGYEENGYVLTAPHVSVKVGGKEVSGTVMRQLLGSPDFEKDREKLFKKAFGYFDNGIYSMMTNKFKKLFEEFKLSDELIKEFLIESTTLMSPTDDGPPTFYRGFDDYKKWSKLWIEDMYAETGWKILQFILGKHAINPDFDYTLKYNVVPAVAYGRKQSGDYGSRFGVKDPINTYKDYISGTVLKNLGYEIIKWMGITPDGKNYTGVEVETPVLPGVGHPDDNVANTEEDKLDLKERINLDEEMKLFIEAACGVGQNPENTGCTPAGASKPKVKIPKIKIPKIKIPKINPEKMKKAGAKARQEFERKEKLYKDKDRKPNMVNGVDEIRNEKDLEHFLFDFKEKANTVKDMDKYDREMDDQYEEQMSVLSREERQQVKEDAKSWKKLGGYEAIQDAIESGEISEQDIRDRNERMSNRAHETVTRVEQPIERGISIPNESVDGFMERFVEGEDVEIPDESGHGSSGFSINGETARYFSKVNNPEETSILMRVEPNSNGEVRGLFIDGEPDTDYEEGEILRSSKSKAKVKKVERVKQPNGKMVMVITLQESDDLTEVYVKEAEEKEDILSKKYLEGPLNPKPRKKKVKEDIKPDVIKSFSIRNSLNSKIWDNQEIKPEIRKKLLVIAKNFFKDLELESNVKLDDITLTGSISNYNWSKFSDVDLHLIIDFKQVDDDSDFVRNYMLAKKTIWNNKHDITIYGFPVEVYVENVGDPHVASGLYSILKDKWIVVPKKKELQIDLQDIRSKAEGYLGSIPVLQKLMKDGKYDEVVEMVEKIQDKLKRMRSSGLAKGGEFSVENLAFKALRRSPFIADIIKMKEDAYDKKMTMKENLLVTNKPYNGKELLLMGGAYGHMNHPFDDKNITFSDLNQIIINGLGGKLNREDGVTEKLDGQNLMVSWVNGKLVTARNKGQLKNFGSSAMDIKGVASKFAGRGDIKDAFVFAMKDLNKSIGSLSDKQKEKIFDNGKRWMNLEVMYPKSANVIDYDKAQIVFHGTLEYNESGTAIGQPKDSARILAGMIKQVNQNVQKHYKIGKPQFLEVPKVQDFSKKKNVYLNRLKKLQNQYKLKDNDTLSKYHQSYWEEFIFNASKQMKYKIPNKVLVNLTKRWAFFDKSYKVQMMRKDIKDEKFLDWALSFDKNDHQKWVKDNMKPFEVLFFDVGAEILKNISGYLAASPKKAVQKIRKDVINAIKTVKSGGDVKKIQTLKLQLDKLNKIGGLSAIVPSEGIVFKYKGKTYKFTGAFAPVNQILGLLNF